MSPNFRRFASYPSPPPRPPPSSTSGLIYSSPPPTKDLPTTPPPPPLYPPPAPPPPLAPPPPISAAAPRPTSPPPLRLPPPPPHPLLLHSPVPPSPHPRPQPPREPAPPRPPLPFPPHPRLGAALPTRTTPVRKLGRPGARYRVRDEARYDRPMTADVYPLQVQLVTLAGWVNRHQQHVIEYLIDENRVLKAQLKGRRLRLTDDRRRRLAAKGQRLGRRRFRSRRRWRQERGMRPR